MSGCSIPTRPTASTIRCAWSIPIRRSYSYGQVVGRWKCPGSATRSIISDGMPAAPRYARTRRTRMLNGATCSRPGLRSSRLHIIDTKPDPRNPKLVKVIEAEEIASRAGYSRPHTIHCGPDAIYVSALGNAAGRRTRRNLSARSREL